MKILISQPVADGPERAAWQRELQDLVGKLALQNEVVPDLFRSLLQVARTHHLAPEEFRSRLVRAGLAYARASELKVVLASAGCSAFLQPPEAPERPSWKETLSAARQERRGLGADRLLAAKVAGLFHRSGRQRLDLTGGRLVLAARPGDLEVLS